MVGDDELDLSLIAAIGDRGRGRSRGRGRPGRGAERVVAVEQATVTAHEGDDADDEHAALLQIASVGEGRPAKRKLAQRSFEMMREVRHAKEVKRLKSQVESAKGGTASLRQKLQVASLRFPGLSQIVAVDSPRDLMLKAERAQSLSMRSPFRDAGAPRNAQTWAAYVVSQTIQTLEQQRAYDMLLGQTEGEAIGRTAVLAWMSDETKQRARLKFTKQFEANINPSMHLSVDTLVGLGRIKVFDHSDEPTADVSYHPKPLQLLGKTTAFLLEGLMKMLPLRIDDGEVLSELSKANDNVLIVFGTDRCATEGSMLRVVWDRIEARAPLKVIPHAEPCGTHGGALVKGRAPDAKHVQKIIHGFARIVRQGKDLNDMHTSMYARVECTAAVVAGEPPEAVKEARKATF